MPDICDNCGVSFDYKTLQDFGAIREVNKPIILHIGNLAVGLHGDPEEDGGEGFTLIYGLVYEIADNFVSVIAPDGTTYEFQRDRISAFKIGPED